MPVDLPVKTTIWPSQGIVTDLAPMQLQGDIRDGQLSGVLTDGRNVRWNKGRLAMRDGTLMICQGDKAANVHEGGFETAMAGTGYVRFAYYFETVTGSPRLIACGYTGAAGHVFHYDGISAEFDHKCPVGDLGGSDSPLWDATTYLGHCYLTKEGSEFLYWDGGAGTFLDVAATSPTGALFPIYLRAFNRRLVGANCFEAGAHHPQGVYWSIIDPPNPANDWNSIVSGAGSEIRVGMRGQITGMEIVSRALAIFAEESIDVARAGPSVYVPFLFSQAEPTLGTRAPHSIRLLGPPYSGELAFLGSDLHIHIFNGNRAIPKTAQKIHEFLKDHVEEDLLDKAWGHVVPTLGTYYLAIPTDGATENNLIIEWNYLTDQFYIHAINDSVGAPSAISRWVRGVPLTWAALKARGDTWASVRGTWGAVKKATGRREVCFHSSYGNMLEMFAGDRDLNGCTTGAPQNLTALGINAYAEFGETDSGHPDTKEIDRVEILADRSGAENLLDVRLYGGYDGSSWPYEASAIHALGPTQDPNAKLRVTGIYHKLRLSMGAIGQQFRLRGFRLAGKLTGTRR